MTPPVDGSGGEAVSILVRRWRTRVLVFVVLLALMWGLGLDEAKSLAGWCTALLLVGLAVSCWGLWRAHWPGPPWWLCMVGFVALALDDYFFGAHDDVSGAILNGLEPMMGRNAALVVAASVLIGTAVLFAWWFVTRLPRRTAIQVAVGFGIAIAGAGVFDKLSGRITAWVGRESEWHRLNMVVEESLELAGIVVVFAALAELLLVARLSAASPGRCRAVRRLQRFVGSVFHPNRV